MIEWTYVTDFPAHTVLMAGQNALLESAEHHARRIAAIDHVRVVRRKSETWTPSRLVLRLEDEDASYEPCSVERATVFTLRIVFDVEPMVDVVTDL